MRQTCRYYPLPLTTHLVSQDDVGMTNVNGADIKQVYAVVDKLRIVINGELKSIARGINTALTQSGVRGESPIEPDGTSKTS